MLPSGLSEWVTDEEILARFLIQKDHYGTSKKSPPLLVAKSAAFMPNPRHNNTSVFRKGKTDVAELQQIREKVNTREKSLKAIAFVIAGAVRQARLQVTPEEGPPAHANIENWPLSENDPKAQKSEQLLLAAQIADAADVILV